MAVKHCDNHSKYVAGCPDCMIKAKTYQASRNAARDYRDKSRPGTGFNQYRRKEWGLRSDANWRRFNEIVKRLQAEGRL